LKADVALVSDTNMYAPDLPTLNVGLRGLVYMEVEPPARLATFIPECTWCRAETRSSASIELLSKAKNADGKIMIPGIYDDVDHPQEPRRRAGRACRLTKPNFLKNEVGSTELTGEPKFSCSTEPGAAHV